MYVSIYIYIYIHVHIYIYIYETQPLEVLSRGQYRCLGTKALLFSEPWPCDPAAETAIQPLIWCL